MAYQQGGTIKEALERIISNEYVLPAIQREFVWQQEQICALFDSVMQGYPFGEFLFWRIKPENASRYRYYGFVRDYHQRNNPHCPDLGILHERPLTAILDGQQRLTAFNIGLRGSMATKLPNKWWNNPDAFPRRVLALNLFSPSKPDEEGNRYVFAFVDQDKIGRSGKELWFQVSDILKFKEGLDITDWLLKQDIEDKKKYRNAFRILDRLYRAVSVDQTVVFFEEESQDIERVLHIFIRRNSGGTVLSYSDLLLSIAVSQWEKLDARKEVHGLVDEMNRIGSGFDFSKDLVLKAGLMLADISSVGFKVENFTRENMKILEDNWQDIRRALIMTVELVASFGFNSRTIRAQSSLLPIAYYIYRRRSPKNFITHQKYNDDRAAIFGWLIRSFLKASGIWGSGLDTLLTQLRRTMQNQNLDKFPVKKIRSTMERRGKGLHFEGEEIEELADMSYGDKRLFPLMALLFPFIDLRNQFHIDHIFPYSVFSPKSLLSAGIDEEEIEVFRDSANRLGNLQLLDGEINNEKRAQLPADWLAARFQEKKERQHYRDIHHLGKVPKTIADFEVFYNARRERLRKRIAELINTV